jgi:predicted RNase H-like HicB family nuclease
MTMYALIENKPDGKYTASLIGWPDITAEGETEDEALTELRQSLTRQLQRARIVPLEIDTSPSDNPWLQLGETFKDNPLLDEVTWSIEEYRHQLDTVEEDS